MKSSAGSECTMTVSVNNAFWPVPFLPLWGKIKSVQPLSLVALSLSKGPREYVGLVLKSFPPGMGESILLLIHQTIH